MSEERSTRFKIRDASSYDPLTAEFDRFTRRLTLPLAERMVDLVRLGRSDRVLDLGTGTGIVALSAAKKRGFQGTITGVDLSEGMLSVARVRACEEGLSNRVGFCRMDAEALGLANSSFDVVLSLFALLHFPNPISALQELFRILRPGGRLVLAVGSGPPLGSWKAFTQAVKFVRRGLGRRRQKLLTAPEFLNSLVAIHLPGKEDPEESWLAREGRKRARSVPQLIREAGFKQVQTQWYGTEAVIQNPEEFWDLQRTFSSFARKRLLDAAPHKIEAVHDEFLRTCRDVQARGGKLVYPYGALYVVAHRPLKSENIVRS